MRLLRRVPLLLVAMAIATAGLLGQSAGATTTTATTTTATTAVLHSTMVGANEVGHAGDPNATGSTLVTLNATTGKVCYVIKVAGLSAPILAGHIHVGAAGVAGPVVIPFPLTGGPGIFAGCTTAAKSLIASIIANPSGFYTNVHNAPFPAGAIRGQLSPLVS